MYCLDYAEGCHPGNQLSFMLHEITGINILGVSFGVCIVSVHVRIVFALQPYIVATIRMHYDAILFSIDASRMKTFIKNQYS